MKAIFSQDELIMFRKQIFRYSKLVIPIGLAPDGNPQYLLIDDEDASRRSEPEIENIDGILKYFRSYEKIDFPSYRYYFDYEKYNFENYIKNINKKIQELGTYISSEGNLARSFEDTGKSINQIIKESVFLICKLYDNKNFISLDKLGDCYVSNSTVLNLFPETILSKIIRDTPLEQLRWNRLNFPTKPGRCTKHIILPLDSTEVKIGEVNPSGISIENESLRDFVFEKLNVLNPKYNKGYYPHERSDFISDHEIRDYFFEELDRPISINKNLGNFENDQISSNIWPHYFNIIISRQTILENFQSLIDEVEKKHNKGIIHGDLKPQNILLDTNGFVPIDSLDIPKGDVSEFYTIAFCAPEQLLLKPVNESTDIYNLGLIILELLDGKLIGEIKTYYTLISDCRFPSSKIETEYKNHIYNKYIDIIVSPEIHFSKDVMDILFKESESLIAWEQFFIKCLAFKKEDRFQNISEFRMVFNKLIKKHPIGGNRIINQNFGKKVYINFPKKQLPEGWLACDQDIYIQPDRRT